MMAEELKKVIIDDGGSCSLVKLLICFGSFKNKCWAAFGNFPGAYARTFIEGRPEFVIDDDNVHLAGRKPTKTTLKTVGELPGTHLGQKDDRGAGVRRVKNQKKRSRSFERTATANDRQAPQEADGHRHDTKRRNPLLAESQKRGGEEPLGKSADEGCAHTTRSKSPDRRVAFENEEIKHRVLKAIAHSPVVILKAPTGAGKSTVVPEWIMESYPRSKVLCSQPLRVAAHTLAKRLAKMRGSLVGEEVGVKVGGVSRTSASTRLVFATDAIAMMELLGAESKYGYVIIDEVHHRSAFVNTMLAYIRHQHARGEAVPRLVLMSATVEAQRLKAFFNTGGKELVPEVLDLAGSPCTSDVVYLENIVFFAGCTKSPSEKDVAKFVFGLQQQKTDGLRKDSRIMVFLSGRRALGKVEETLRELGGDDLDIYQLHSGIQDEQMHEMIDSPADNKRVIYLSTNVAESAVTIPNLDVVVDLCECRRMEWDDFVKKTYLMTKPISIDEADQRAGRTGRLRKGQVFRLVTKSTFDELSPHPSRAPQDASLRQVILFLLGCHACGIRDVRKFMFGYLEPPREADFDGALLFLEELGLLARKHGKTALTPLGREVQKVGLDPNIGLLVVNGLSHAVLADILIIASIHQQGTRRDENTVLPLLLRPALLSSAGVTSGQLTLRYPDGLWQRESDLLCCLRAFKAWREYRTPDQPIREEMQWCWEHMLSLRALVEIEGVALHLVEKVVAAGLVDSVADLTSNTMPEDRYRSESIPLDWRPDYDSKSRCGRRDQDIGKLVGDPDEERNLALAWCIAISFPHNLFSVAAEWGRPKGFPLMRLTDLRWSAKDLIQEKPKAGVRLKRFLSEDLRIEVKACHGTNLDGPRPSFAVTLPDLATAHKLANVTDNGTGPKFPFRRAEIVEHKVEAHGPAYVNEETIEFLQGSVVLPLLKPTLTVSCCSHFCVERTKSPLRYAHVFSTLTALPSRLRELILACAYASSQVLVEGLEAEVSFTLCGIQEVYWVSGLTFDQLSLVDNIRKLREEAMVDAFNEDRAQKLKQTVVQFLQSVTLSGSAVVVRRFVKLVDGTSISRQLFLLNCKARSSEGPDNGAHEQSLRAATESIDIVGKETRDLFFTWLQGESYGFTFSLSIAHAIEFSCWLAARGHEGDTFETWLVLAPNDAGMSNVLKCTSLAVRIMVPRTKSGNPLNLDRKKEDHWEFLLRNGTLSGYGLAFNEKGDLTHWMLTMPTFSQLAEQATNSVAMMISPQDKRVSIYVGGEEILSFRVPVGGSSSEPQPKYHTLRNGLTDAINHIDLSTRYLTKVRDWLTSEVTEGSWDFTMSTTIAYALGFAVRLARVGYQGRAQSTWLVVATDEHAALLCLEPLEANYEPPCNDGDEKFRLRDHWDELQILHLGDGGFLYNSRGELTEGRHILSLQKSDTADSRRQPCQSGSATTSCQRLTALVKGTVAIKVSGSNGAVKVFCKGENVLETDPLFAPGTKPE